MTITKYVSKISISKKLALRTWNIGSPSLIGKITENQSFLQTIKCLEASLNGNWCIYLTFSGRLMTENYNQLGHVSLARLYFRAENRKLSQRVKWNWPRFPTSFPSLDQVSSLNFISASSTPKKKKTIFRLPY